MAEYKCTPIKQSISQSTLCVVCGGIPREARNVQAVPSGRTKVNLSDLLYKYGAIQVEHGKMCKKCAWRLTNLDKRVQSFRQMCSENFSKITKQSKRMASSPYMGNAYKRQDVDTSPETNKKLTPILKEKSEAKRTGTPITTRFTTPRPKSASKIPTPSRINQTAGIRPGRKQLFLSTEASEKELLLAELVPFDDTTVGMEIEISNTVGQHTVHGVSSCVTDDNNSKHKFENEKESDQSNVTRSINPTIKDHHYIQTRPNKVSAREVKQIDQPLDHDYLNSQSKQSKFSSMYQDIRRFMSHYRQENVILSADDQLPILQACETQEVDLICDVLLSNQTVRNQIVNKMSNLNEKSAQELNARKHNKSVLMEKSPSALKQFNWFDVIEEFKQNFPDLFSQILALMLKREDHSLNTKMEKVIPKLGLIYGVIMQSRNMELSLIQRLNSSILLDSITDVKVFDRLQRLGVCLGFEGSLYFLNIIGGKFNEAVLDLVKKKQRFRIIGDNINWAVGVHDMRTDHRSHMVHAFGSAILVQNMDFSYCSNIYPQLDFTQTPCQQFIPSAEDYELYKHDYVVLMSRVVVKYLTYFQTFEDILPNTLSVPIQANLAKKTKVVPLPVLFKNEQKYQDVVDILEEYEKIIKEAHDAAGIDINDVRIHIGGDQLTRERFSGAKCLRAHEDTPSARFEHLSPITFELFHMHMNFLKMTYDILYDDRSVQDEGTLKFLQNLISRTNVGENINTHYDADKDFFISVVDVHIVESFMEFFGLDDLNSAPTQHAPPVFMDGNDKKEWYFRTVGKLVEKFVLPSRAFTEEDPDNVEIEGTVFNIILPDGRKLNIKMQKKTTFEEEEKTDGMFNYAKRILELGLLFKDLLDATKLPERNRHISLLKLTMLFFKSHRNLSKYSYEILRLLVHQICILSERAANEEFYGLFVNTNGHTDGHIPADRRMEYLVKTVKTHIKHMFSNKTEKNIRTRTSAISTITDIGDTFDRVCNVVTRTKHHSHKSSEGDERILLNTVHALRPFNKTPGRGHEHFASISASAMDDLDISHYHEWINRNKYDFSVEMGN